MTFSFVSRFRTGGHRLVMRHHRTLMTQQVVYLQETGGFFDTDLCPPWTDSICLVHPTRVRARRLHLLLRDGNGEDPWRRNEEPSPMMIGRISSGRWPLRDAPRRIS